MYLSWLWSVSMSVIFVSWSVFFYWTTNIRYFIFNYGNAAFVAKLLIPDNLPSISVILTF